MAHKGGIHEPGCHDPSMGQALGILVKFWMELARPDFRIRQNSVLKHGTKSTFFGVQCILEPDFANKKQCVSVVHTAQFVDYHSK